MIWSYGHTCAHQNNEIASIADAFIMILNDFIMILNDNCVR